MSTTEVAGHPLVVLDIPKGHPPPSVRQGRLRRHLGPPAQFTTHPPASRRWQRTPATTTRPRSRSAAGGGGKVATTARNAAQEEGLADLPHVRD